MRKIFPDCKFFVELFRIPIVFRQYNQFDTDLYRLYTDFLQIIYKLSTDYLQVLLYKDYILTICRLSTDYIQVLHNRKIDYFGTKVHLFLVEKMYSICTESIIVIKMVVHKSVLYSR